MYVLVWFMIGFPYHFKANESPVIKFNNLAFMCNTCIVFGMTQLGIEPVTSPGLFQAVLGDRLARN